MVSNLKPVARIRSQRVIQVGLNRCTTQTNGGRAFPEQAVTDDVAAANLAVKFGCRVWCRWSGGIYTLTSSRARFENMSEGEGRLNLQVRHELNYSS